LWYSRFRGLEHSLLHAPRLQPLEPPDAIPWARRPEPCRADAVATGASVALQHPWRGVRMSQPREAWPHRLRGGALGAAALGVRIALSCRHGSEGSHGERRHGSSRHRGHRQGAQAMRTAVLRPIAAPQRLGVVPSGPHFAHGAGFLLRRVPEHSVDTRRPCPIVARHPFDGQRCAAPGMGEQMGQGSHLAPPPSLHGLHKPRLEPPHRPVPRIPSKGGPGSGGWGACPSRWHRCPLPSRLKRLSKRACDARPEGRLPALAWGDVPLGSTPLHPLTGWPALLPSSHARTSLGAPCGVLALLGALRGCPGPLP
jgi:hypothetical protein